MTTYDQVAYPSNAFPQSHPDRLAVVATLLGVTPPPAERCRVLELGCARGGNIIPMAFGLPGSRFLGIDNSTGPIEEGRRVISGMGLVNIELRAASILDVDASYGQFDYIISHGIYSWVPAHVRDKVLDIYRSNLAPEGIGYISFNALPGWRLRGMVRDMMMYHNARFPGAAPPRQITMARELLGFMAQSVPGETNPFGVMLRHELKAVNQTADGHFYHDHLEGDNHAFYFHQFCEHLQAKELRYLGEATFSDMADADLPPAVRQKLATLGTSLLEREQYLDFVRNRVFRQCLVIHERLQSSYTLAPELLKRFYFASAFKPAGEPRIAEGVPLEFIGPKGEKAASTNAIVQAALCSLADAWPRSLTLDDLCRQAAQRMSGTAFPGRPDGLGRPSHVSGMPDADQLAQELLSAFMASYANDSSGMIELRLRPLPVVNAPAARPLASALARWQAANEGQETLVNLRHESVPVPLHVQKLLPLLDGTRDYGALADALVAMCRRGELQASLEGPAATDERKARELFVELVCEQLSWLTRAGFITG